MWQITIALLTLNFNILISDSIFHLRTPEGFRTSHETHLKVRDKIFMFSTGREQKFSLRSPLWIKHENCVPLLSDVLAGSFESSWYPEVEYGLRFQDT